MFRQSFGNWVVTDDKVSTTWFTSFVISDEVPVNNYLLFQGKRNNVQAATQHCTHP